MRYKHYSSIKKKSIRKFKPLLCSFNLLLHYTDCCMHAAEFFLHLFPVSTQKQRRLKLKSRLKVDKVSFNLKESYRILTTTFLSFCCCQNSSNFSWIFESPYSITFEINSKRKTPTKALHRFCPLRLSMYYKVQFLLWRHNSEHARVSLSRVRAHFCTRASMGIDTHLTDKHLKSSTRKALRTGSRNDRQLEIPCIPIVVNAVILYVPVKYGAFLAPFLFSDRRIPLARNPSWLELNLSKHETVPFGKFCGLKLRVKNAEDFPQFEGLAEQSEF